MSKAAKSRMTSKFFSHEKAFGIPHLGPMLDVEHYYSCGTHEISKPDNLGQTWNNLGTKTREKEKAGTKALYPDKNGWAEKYVA